LNGAIDWLSDSMIDEMIDPPVDRPCVRFSDLCSPSLGRVGKSARARACPSSAAPPPTAGHWSVRPGSATAADKDATRGHQACLAAVLVLALLMMMRRRRNGGGTAGVVVVAVVGVRMPRRRGGRLEPLRELLPPRRAPASSAARAPWITAACFGLGSCDVPFVRMAASLACHCFGVRVCRK